MIQSSLMPQFIFACFLAFFLSACTSSKIDPLAEAEKELKVWLDLLPKDDVKALYLKTHPSLQSQTPFADFSSLVDMYQMTSVLNYEISQARLVKGVYECTVELALKDRSLVPVQFRLSKATDRFLVILLEVDALKFYQNSGIEDLNRSDFERILRPTLVQFQADLKQQNFTVFHTGLSRIWKKQTGKEELLQNYSRLNQPNFQAVDFAKSSLNFHPSSGIRQNGLLYLKGEVSGLTPILFEVQYFYEDSRWKPTGFQLSY